MTQRVLRTAVAALTAFLLAPATTSAHHRPNKEVLVGGAISQTGRFAEPAGRQANAIKMWVEEVNGRGGLLDHKINLVLL
jgi:ABC-type branched-subunit amino acid transport system substrate-binding protein